MKKIFSIIIGLLGFSVAAQAQVHVGANFQLGFPSGEYREVGGDVGVGGGLNVWVPFARQIPVYFGLDFGYMLMSRHEQRINQQANIVGPGGQVLGSIPINYRVVTNNNFLQGHVGLRIKAPLPMVQPYADGLVGFNYLYTRTKIFDENNNNNNNNNNNGGPTEINARNQAQDFVFSYGGGAGAMIRITDNFGIDVRCVYLLGGQAEYYARQDIENWTVTVSNPNQQGVPQDASVEAVPRRSRTDLFYSTIGIVFSF